MASSEASQLRILVVDDNAGTVAATVKFLELSGHLARGAATGKRALDETASWLPDVVVLDIGLPDMDGFSVLRAIKDSGTTRPMTFVAVSGRDDDATKARGLREGFDHFLTKPVRLDRLTELFGPRSK